MSIDTTLAGLIPADWPPDAEHDEDYEEEEYEGEEADDVNDQEEIARRLNEQLWADISRAQAETLQTQTPTLSNKHSAALATMKSILDALEKDAAAQQTLALTVVPDCDGATVLELFHQSISAGSVPRATARTMSGVLQALSQSDSLFGHLPTKRKRDTTPDDGTLDIKRARSDLQHPITHAVRVVQDTLSSHPAPVLDAPTLSALQLPLHQIFLFAVTSAPRAASPALSSALRELGALIQVLSILAGAPCAPTPALDIGTAVYPCPAPACGKIFRRLFSLRAHSATHLPGGAARPFRCGACPAAFARNHDLKRHARLHAPRAWRCGGCAKVFSRRDAITRHRKPGGPCVGADAEEVELGADEDAREARRARLWGGAEQERLEEGEVAHGEVRALQEAVLELHAPLRARVAGALGVPEGLAFPTQAEGEEEQVAAESEPQTTSFAVYGLSEEQAKMLEEAIAQVASAAQAQAEADAAKEEDEEEEVDEGAADGDGVQP